MTGSVDFLQRRLNHYYLRADLSFFKHGETIHIEIDKGVVTFRQPLNTSWRRMISFCNHRNSVQQRVSKGGHIRFSTPISRRFLRGPTLNLLLNCSLAGLCHEPSTELKSRAASTYRLNAAPKPTVSRREETTCNSETQPF